MINNIVLMGRICHDLELKKTPSGLSVLKFSIAVDRGYTKQGEERKADFIDLVAFRHNAEFIERYFNKGAMIAITGKLQVENYTDKDGNKRKSVEVVVDSASFCGGKNDSKPNIDIAPPEFEVIDDDEELPF